MLSFLRHLISIGLVIFIGWCVLFVGSIFWMKWAIHFIKTQVLQ